MLKGKVKAIIVLSVAVSLALTVVNMTDAHTEEEPFVVDLIAGQHMDVGNISVWNDGEFLYVKYNVTEEGWFITVCSGGMSRKKNLYHPERYQAQ